MRPLSTALLLLAVAGSAHAEDPPGFDRPGLGFSTDTVKAGALAVELGFPGYERARDETGALTRETSSTLLLRTGLSPNLELQVSTSPWNRLRTSPDGTARTTDRGAGDTGVAVKWAGPGSTDRTAWALRGSAVVAPGDSAFSDGRQYALAASIEHHIDDRWTAAFFASHQRGGGEYSTTWAPSISMQATDRLGLFAEAGYTTSRDAPHEALAGAGLTWALTPRVQLDASFDAGLDEKSPDLQAGLGISVYLD